MRYALVTFRHKYFVFLAGISLSVPVWRLLLHDLSKFTPAELSHYQRQFFGDKGDPEGFARAWLHHMNHNPHHWEYWCLRSDHSKGGSGAIDGWLPMPETYVREMLADWIGAGKTYKDGLPFEEWFIKNFPKMRLHPLTMERLRNVLCEAGYKEIAWSVLS